MGTIEKSFCQSPYLVRNATARTGEDTLPGHYSDELDMWVINTPEGPQPIIEQGTLNELVTKTKVNAEQDDEAVWQLEMMTKTAHNVESDDERPPRPHPALELMTKTRVDQEQDDTADEALVYGSRYYEG